MEHEELFGMQNWDFRNKFHLTFLYHLVSAGPTSYFGFIKLVFLSGGIIPSVEVIVQRQYPLLFMETLSDGTKISRDTLQEELAQANHTVFNQLFFVVLLIIF